LAFFVLPGLGQVNSILPSKPVNIREMTVTSEISRPETATANLERAGPAERTRYRWSIAAVIAANAADAASSWSQQEANPAVVRGGAQFGATSIAIKSRFAATSLVIQHIALRHRPDLYKKLAWLNFGTAGVLGGVAHYNMRVR
jgi:hypothetical protein